MLFSILVANFNNGSFFKDCYESILSQTYKKWEVIIVDDASTDSSIEIIMKIIGDDNRFQIYRNKKNYGVAYSKDYCARLANGQILGYLDPDDALKPNALNLMVDIHLKNPLVSIASSRYEHVFMDMEHKSDGKNGEALPDGYSYLSYGKGAITHFASFKKKAYLKTEGIDLVMKRAVDQDLYYKLEEHGEHFFIDQVLYSYRIHSRSISQNENEYKATYWHLYAKTKAFKRRNKTRAITNLQRQEIRSLWSQYYLYRFNMLRNKNGKFRSKIYHLILSIFYGSFDKIILKLKLLILLFLGRI